MRFLKFNDHGEPSLIERKGDDIPAYGILSHTWGADSEEVTTGELSEAFNSMCRWAVLLLFLRANSISTSDNMNLMEALTRPVIFDY
jgi:hypothetical protein